MFTEFGSSDSAGLKSGWMRPSSCWWGLFSRLMVMVMELVVMARMRLTKYQRTLRNSETFFTFSSPGLLPESHSLWSSRSIFRTTKCTFWYIFGYYEYSTYFWVQSRTSWSSFCTKRRTTKAHLFTKDSPENVPVRSISDGKGNHPRTPYLEKFALLLPLLYERMIFCPPSVFPWQYLQPIAWGTWSSIEHPSTDQTRKQQIPSQIIIIIGHHGI